MCVINSDLEVWLYFLKLTSKSQIIAGIFSRVDESINIILILEWA